MKQIVFFTTLYLAFSQETLLKEKVGICLHFLNLKITKDEQGFKKIFESVPHESADLIMNKVIGEMLLNCVENVDDSLALDLDRTRSQQ